MNPLLLLLLTGFLSLVHAAAPPAPRFAGKGLTVELVSEVTSIRPGQPFYAGLFIHHDGGSHTYWKNPGLAGVATKLEWSLPDGWKAGEIEWPAPDKVKMASIDTHGYERDVLLMVRITPPATVAESSITLKTQAAWMCCARTCHPGFCDLILTLPVQASGEPAWDNKWRPVFEKERQNVPVPVSGWTFSARRDGKHVILSARPEKPGTSLPAAPVFMSADNFICSHPPQKWETTATGLRATLEISEIPPKNVTALTGLLTSTTGWLPDSSRAVEISVPLE